MKSSLEKHLWCVVLAGGIGSRFWPASTPQRPKQLLRLASEKPLIEETTDRIASLVPLERVRILTGAPLDGAIQEALPYLSPANFLLESRAAGTGPALVWAAVELERIDPDAVMISLHADHVIHPARLFRQQLREAAELAVAHRKLFTLGAVPTRPETGYGYILRGEALPPHLGTAQGFAVERFVEKPDLERATAYLREGGYLWNTGIFIWRVHDLLKEVERHTPEIAPLLALARQGRRDEFFARVPSLSIDEGLLERSDQVAVLPAHFEWDDVGAWDAIFRTHPRDEHGNVLIGNAFAVEAERNALYADDGPVVAFGVDDLVIVRTAGVTFVTHRERSADLKALLPKLPERLRTLE